MMPTEKGLITITHLGQNKEPAKQDGVGQSVVTSVSVISDQLVIAGENLDGVTKVRIIGPSGFDQTFAIESQSGSNLVANGLSNIAFAVGSVFDLILTDAQGAATHQVTFTLQDGAVTASKLDDMGAGVGQVLKYDGTTWGPSDLGALTYAGTWDASSATVPNVSPSAGEYYIVSVAGTGIDLSDGSGSRNFAVGDWLVYNNTTSRWDKIDNATSVTSFNGRNGPISPATNDYTWAQIDKTTSPIGDLSNVNTTGAGVGSVLKFDGTNWVVGTDDTAGAGSVDSSAITDGSIVDADVNASAAIAQSKIANLTTDLAAKLNLSGGTMTGDLTVPNLITSGNVDGVDVSALNTTVGNNSTAIAGKQNTITTGTTAQYLRGDLSLSTFATDARSAAVLNSTAGTETDQAASVAAMKTYVSSQVSGSASVLDGGNATGATVVVGTNDAQSLQFETNNTPAMTILNGGNVGIGTTNPSANLEIVGSGYRIGRITSTSSGAALSIDSPPGEQSFLRYESGTSLRWTIGKNSAAESGSNAGSDLAFSRWDDSGGFIGAAMLISRSTGNVSIGTTAPATKLDVEGKVTVGPIDATAGNTGAIALEELAANGTNSVTFRAPDSLAANYTLTMPADDGSSGQVLTTDGSGVLSWAAAPAATSVSASSGSAATPSMSFSSDPNTGLFSGGADVISFSAGGSEIFSASSSGLVSPTTGGGSVSTANGTASAPTFSFAGDTDTGWFRPAANTLAAATAGSERVRIDASGNVGIGTTSPGDASPAGELTLEVGGNSNGSNLSLVRNTSTSGWGNGSFTFRNTHNVSANQNIAMIQAITEGTSTNKGGHLRFYTKQDSVNNPSDDHPTVRMTITHNGNVGIGTTSPATKFDVDGGTGAGTYATIRGGNSVLEQTHLRLKDNGTSSGNIINFEFSHTTDQSNARIRSTSVGSSSASGADLSFETASDDSGTFNTAQLYLDNSGNVGIGTTNPSQPFEVSKDSWSTITGTTAGASEYPVFLGQRSTGTVASKTVPSSGAIITSIHGRSWDGDSYDLGASIDMLLDNTPGDGDIPSAITFNTSADGSNVPTERLRINSAGNVGIGTTVPNTRFHVNGGSAHFNTNSDTNPVIISRGGDLTEENIKIGVLDGITTFHYINDEDTNKIQFRLENTDTEAGGGAAANDNVVMTLVGGTHGGNVGIGTTSPTLAQLQVDSSSGLNGTWIKANSTDGRYKGLRLTQNNSFRWDIMSTNDSETGSNVGSDFRIHRFNDAGSFIDAPLTILRSSGNVGIGTTSPDVLLEVKDISSGANEGIRIVSANSVLTFLDFGDEDDKNVGSISYDHSSDRMRFRTNDVPDRMVINSSGNVGIGTSTPVDTLDIRDSSTGGVNIRLENTEASGRAYKIGVQGSGGSTPGSLVIRDQTATTNRFVIDSSGNVGIGTVTPSYNLHVVGSAGKTTGSSWTSISDRRLKDIQGDYEYGLKEIMQLNTVRFNYSEGNELGLPSENNIVGFVAQEVQQVIPDAVHVRDDGFLELNVDPIHWALINATQEQQEIIKNNVSMMELMGQGIEDHRREIASIKHELSQVKDENKRMKIENDAIKVQLKAIKAALCSLKPTPQICR